VHPSTLILNTSLPERIGTPNSDAGRQEVAFYKDVAATMQVELVPRCFEAKCEAGTRAWHLLREDLTEPALIATAWPLPPTVGNAGRSSAQATVRRSSTRDQGRNLTSGRSPPVRNLRCRGGSSIASA
jgi:hypothetical protein